MLQKKSFPIMIAPEQRLYVDAYSHTDALLAAQDAVPHLTLTPDDRDAFSRLDSKSVAYFLSCLLCSWKPHDNRLVTLQEHLMETHGLSSNDFRHCIRVLLGTHKEGCYVWALPSEIAAHKGLSSLSYMRAAYVNLSCEEEDNVLGRKRYTTLVFARSSSCDAPSSEVILVSQDEYAWYGFNDTEAYSAFMRGDTYVGEPTVWPKSLWGKKSENPLQLG